MTSNDVFGGEVAVVLLCIGTVLDIVHCLRYTFMGLFDTHGLALLCSLSGLSPLYWQDILRRIKYVSV
jgi:hypothetical protein